MSDSNTITIKKAVRPQKPLKMVLDGLAGSGKTYTALRLAFQLGKNVCVIDTEHGLLEDKAEDFASREAVPAPERREKGILGIYARIAGSAATGARL